MQVKKKKMEEASPNRALKHELWTDSTFLCKQKFKTKPNKSSSRPELQKNTTTRKGWRQGDGKLLEMKRKPGGIWTSVRRESGTTSGRREPRVGLQDPGDTVTSPHTPAALSCHRLLHTPAPPGVGPRSLPEVPGGRAGDGLLVPDGLQPLRPGGHHPLSFFFWCKFRSKTDMRGKDFKSTEVQRAVL